MAKTTPRPGTRRSPAARGSVVAAARDDEERRHQRIRIGAMLGAVLVVIGIALLVSNPFRDAASGPPGTGAAPAPAANRFGATTLPPWPAPADPTPGMRAAGLPISDMSAMAQHFHAHLDVQVGGAPVPVPADVGIDRANGSMSALHTHDDSGLIHVESSDPGGRYTLGQLFNEWNVALDSTRLGGLTVTPGTTLRAFVNGVEVPANPAAIELGDHQEIALIYGPAGAPVTPPTGYDFSNA